MSVVNKHLTAPLLYSAIFAALTGCSKPSFEYVGEKLVPLGDRFTESFSQDKAQGEVDILIVSDNSSSMAMEQMKLGQRFDEFTSALNQIDYHIGVITTDIESNNAISKGELVQIPGEQTRILTASHPNPQQTFLNLVTVGTGGSGNEQPMSASVMAFNKRDGINSGFFRDDTDVALLIISDEDEMSDGLTGMPASSVVTAFNDIWGESKRLLSFAIIIKPGDTACLAQQTAESAIGAHYGTRAAELASLTNGDTFSICDSDYSNSLKAIGQKVRNLVFSIQLAQIPVARSVQVEISTGEKIKFKVKGNRIIFDHAPQQGAQIIVSYNIPAVQ